MTTSPRRVGAETSKTRDALLDCVEKMMLEEGYPSVTYRALAAKAGVTPSLVQYYFPSLDDIFVVDQSEKACQQAPTSHERGNRAGHDRRGHPCGVRGDLPR